MVGWGGAWEDGDYKFEKTVVFRSSVWILFATLPQTLSCRFFVFAISK